MPSPIFWAIVAREGLLLATQLAELWSDKPLDAATLDRARALLTKRGEDYFSPTLPGLPAAGV